MRRLALALGSAACFAPLASSTTSAQVPAEATPSAPAGNEAAPDLTAWNDEARVHAVSSRIVRGVLHVDAAAVRVARGSGGYVDVEVEVHETIVGAEQPRVTFRVYVHADTDPTRSPVGDADRLLALDGEDRIAFLHTSEGHAYLADEYHGLGVVEPDRSAIVRARKREMLHRRWLQQELPRDRKRASAVRQLIDELVTDPDRERAAFARLQAHGPAAVVELIAAMDDRRPLPEKSLVLTNRAADAFESARRYAPEQVVDGLAAVLNQLTGESFGFPYNGATPAERNDVVRAWRLYAHYLLAARAAEGRARPDAKR